MTTRTADRWQLVQTLFDRVADLPETDRVAELAKDCGDDDDLRDEVMSLVANADGGESMRRAIAEGIASLTTAGHVGERVGPYRLVDVIGEGGMGVVYLGERDDGTYRGRVAIKILRSGFGSTHVRARFHDERQILAALDHPNIVRLVDGGTTDDGLPYLVMERIDGVPLAKHASTVSIRRRVELVGRIARAVQYAHQKLIVHRDLKPNNVLVTRDGTPKLLDFGIAKLLAPTAELAREAETRTGVAMLTLDYASPEQARGDAVAVASDVYSLGAVLFSLLVGRPPHLPGKDALDTLGIICEVDAPLASSVAPSGARREIAGDLDNIVARALQKRPADRYASMSELADDLDRYLTGRPVAAREATLIYRARKLVSRHRLGVAIAATVTIALATATVWSIASARRADREAELAATQNRELLVEEGWQELERGDYMRSLPYLVAAMNLGEDNAATRFLVGRALRPLSRRVLHIDVPSGLYFTTSQDGRSIAIAGPGGARVYDDTGTPISPPISTPAETPTLGAGGTIVLPAIAGAVEIRDTHTGALVHRLTAPHTDLAELSPDGRWIAVRFDRSPRTLCEVATDHCRILPDAAIVTFTPDGNIVLGEGGAIEIQTPAGEPVRRLAVSGTVVDLLFADHRLFAGTTAKTLVTVDLATGAVSEHAGWNAALVMSPDGTELATIGVANTIDLRDGRTGELRTLLPGATPWRHVAWSPDGTKLVATGIDNTFRVWNMRDHTVALVVETVAPSGQQAHSMGGALGAVFSHDSRRLITASATELTWWDVEHTTVVDDIPTTHSLYAATYSPDETKIAIAGLGGYVALYDLTRRALVFEREVEANHVFDAEWSPEGSRFVVAGESALARIYAVDGSVAVTLAGHTGNVNRAGFSPDGQRIATAGSDRTIRLWNATTGAELARVTAPSSASAVSWSRDGGKLASATWDGTLEVLDPTDLHAVAAITTHRQLLDASLSPDDALIASASHGGEIEVWNVATATRIASCEGHTGPATMVAWSPDGQLLASSADDSTARIWDPRTCRRLATLAIHGGCMQVMWSRDGRRLLVTDNAGRILVYDVARDDHSLGELDDLLARDVPWRFVDGRLELR